MPDEFPDSSGHVYTIPPSCDFLGVIAAALDDVCGLKHSPEALADALIFLPNRRSGRDLHTALLARNAAHDRKGLIAPAIRVLGDIGSGEWLGGRDEQTGQTIISPAARRGVLARLARHWHTVTHGETIPLAQALASADDIADLVGQGELAGQSGFPPFEDLIADTDLADHWRTSAHFLHFVISEGWPAYLRQSGQCSPEMRRVSAIREHVRQWKERPPSGPVWVVGSTGVTPVDGMLMKAIAHLPRGAVIMRGLDTDAHQSDWEHIADSPSHPQFAMKRTLDHIGIAPEQVRTLPGANETDQAAARRRFLYEALAPAAATRDWTKRLHLLAASPVGPASPVGADRDDTAICRAFTRRALSGIGVMDTETEADEAMAAALALREIAERPGARAALVTPNGGLRRRVSALLGRWDLHVPPSAGTPFLQTSSGRLVAAIMHMLPDPADPVALLALLKHEAVRLRRDSQSLHDVVLSLEIAALRGPRRHHTLSDLAGLASKPACALLTDMEAAIAPMLTMATKKRFAAHDGADAMRTTLTALVEADDDASALPEASQNALDIFHDKICDIGAGYGELDARDWPDLVMAVATDMHVRPSSAHPRLAIWGPLEARLQHRDRFILASMNEGVWPRPAQMESVLPRRLRPALGLPDPEERLGLSAHDFAQLACSSEILLLRARMAADQPTIASRWLWRLRKLAEAGMGKDADPALNPPSVQALRVWVRACRTDRASPGTGQIIDAPAPRPPLAARPRRWSVSSARDLMHDPYIIYARNILRLKRLDPPGAPFDARHVGNAVHKALERFETEPNHVAGTLVTMIAEALAEGGQNPDEIALRRPLWMAAAQDYLGWKARRPQVKAVHCEIQGEMSLGEGVVLRARADRIEELHDGTLSLIDFKTGAPKKKEEVVSGKEPQLPLEAALAMHGGFAGLDAAPVSEMIYYRFSTARSGLEKNGQPLDIDNPGDTAEQILALFTSCLTAFSAADHPYSPRKEEGTWPSDYDRLARRAEWSSAHRHDE